MINYTAVNPQVYLTKVNCKLINNAIGDNRQQSNLSINNLKIYQEEDNGCYIRGNLIRYGFGTDYVLIFKKNLLPILNHAHQAVNNYVRLTCYSGSCYSEDNIVIADKHDIYAELLRAEIVKQQKFLTSTLPDQ